MLSRCKTKTTDFYPQPLLKLSRRKTAIVSIDPEPIVDADTRVDWHFATSSPIPLSPVQSSLPVDTFSEEEDEDT